MRRSFRGSCLGGLVGVFALTMAGCGAPSFPTGTGTATFTWHSIAYSGNELKTPPQPFAGTIAGIPVSGTALAAVFPASGLKSLPPRLTLARWTGRFQGHTFSLVVEEETAALRNLNSFTFDVDGTLGSQNVRFIVGPPSRSNPNAIAFHGTVGDHHVTGSVTSAPARGASNRATATFTISG